MSQSKKEMTDRHAETLKALLSPEPASRYQAIGALERASTKEDIERFIAYARDLDAAAALKFCSVLAGATRPELVALLGYYACRKESALRARALEALERVPGSFRVHCLMGLLDNPDPATREVACRLLGSSGSLAPRSELVNCLRDTVPDVVLTALRALQRMNCRDVTSEVLSLLDHPQKEVRAAAIEALVDLAPEDSFPASKLASLVANDEAASVRVAAAWALGSRPTRKGKNLLLRALESDKDTAVRSAAATALGAYPENSVVSDVLKMKANETQVSVALSCNRALDAMDESVVLSVCSQMLREEDARTRVEVATTLGDLSFEGAVGILMERLSVETQPEVRAALLEALGHRGSRDAWVEVRDCLTEKPPVAYAAVCALADLLDQNHIEEFIELLSTLDSSTMREAALKRLKLYGQTRGLPGTLRSILVPLIRSEQKSVALAAVEVAGWLGERDMVVELLAAAQESREQDFIRTVSLAVMSLCQNSLVSLLEITGNKRLSWIGKVTEALTGLGKDGVEACRRLAGLQAEEVAGARSALQAAARVEPASLVDALQDASEGEVEAILQVWRSLPEPSRRSVPVNWLSLLHSLSARVRELALNALDAESGLAFMDVVAEMALIDPEEKVRECAKRATKRLVEPARMTDLRSKP